MTDNTATDRDDEALVRRDAAKLADVVIDVTKRWFGDQDTADARVVALAFAGVLGAFLAQIADEGDKKIMVKKTCEAIVAGTGVPLIIGWHYEPKRLPATEEQRQ